MLNSLGLVVNICCDIDWRTVVQMASGSYRFCAWGCAAEIGMALNEQLFSTWGRLILLHQFWRKEMSAFATSMYTERRIHCSQTSLIKISGEASQPIHDPYMSLPLERWLKVVSAFFLFLVWRYCLPYDVKRMHGSLGERQCTSRSLLRQCTLW